VDYDFTANLEDQLDEISRGEKTWVPILDAFWQPFSRLVTDKMDSVNRSDILQSRELGTDPATGKPVSIRMRRFGPFAQIGTKEDEEKPIFASLRAGMKMDTVTLEEALELFKLPRHLGETADGKAISTNVGRFGPYVKYGSEYASMGKTDDPHTLTLERALEIIAEKKQKDADKLLKDFGNGIQIIKGRWGPFLKHGKINAKLPKDRDINTVTLEEAQALITAATPVTKKAASKTAEPTAKASPKKAKVADTKAATPAKKPTAKKKAS
jgi:DNA topoisomerase-1